MAEVCRRRPAGDFLEELTRDYDRIGELVDRRAPDSGERIILRIGLESELLCVNDESEPEPVVKQLVGKLEKPYFMTELNAASVEVITDAFAAAPGVFLRMWEQYSSRVQEFARFALPRVNRVIGGGLQSVVDPARWPPGQILTPGVRYQQATAYLTGRREGFEFSFETLDDKTVTIDNPYSPLAASLTQGFSPNVQVALDKIGLVANLAAATAFVAPAVASCSPFAAGKIGAWCSRIPMWALGIDPEAELTAFAPGGYFADPGRGAVMEWLRFIMLGEQVLEPAEVGEGKAKKDFAAMNLMIGTRWVQVGRIRFAIQDGVFTVWFESRPWDAQLFPWDNFVNLIFFTGLIAGLVGEVGSAEELISYDEAKLAFQSCVQRGDCELTWRSQRRRAREVIKNDLVPIARRGLVAEGLYDELAIRSLDAVNSRCEGKSGADFMIGWLDSIAHVFPSWGYALGKMSFDVGGTHLTPKLYDGVHLYVDSVSKKRK